MNEHQIVNVCNLIRSSPAAMQIINAIVWSLTWSYLRDPVYRNEIKKIITEIESENREKANVIE